MFPCVYPLLLALVLSPPHHTHNTDTCIHLQRKPHQLCQQLPRCRTYSSVPLLRKAVRLPRILVGAEPSLPSRRGSPRQDLPEECCGEGLLVEQAKNSMLVVCDLGVQGPYGVPACRYSVPRRQGPKQAIRYKLARPRVLVHLAVADDECRILVPLGDQAPPQYSSGYILPRAPPTTRKGRLGSHENPRGLLCFFSPMNA